jgi:hypothetical protein
MAHNGGRGARRGDDLDRRRDQRHAEARALESERRADNVTVDEASSALSPRRTVVRAMTASDDARGRRMPYGICSGCGEEGPLPPFGDGMCFLCATDGPPGNHSPAIGAVSEDTDARGEAVPDDDEVEERGRDIRDIFAEAAELGAQGMAKFAVDFRFFAASRMVYFHEVLSLEQRETRINEQIAAIREEWRKSHPPSEHRCSCGVPVTRNKKGPMPHCPICMIERLREYSRNRARKRGATARGRYKTSLVDTVDQAVRRAEAKRRWVAAARSDRRAAGLCQSCGKTPATSRCDACNEKRRSSRRSRRRVLGEEVR